MQYHVYREQQEWAERQERQERAERQGRQQKRFVSPFLQVHERRGEERRAATASPRLGPPKAYVEAKNAAAEANLVPETETARPGTSPSKSRLAHYDARRMTPDIWAVHGASLGGGAGASKMRGKRAGGGKVVPRRPASQRGRRARTAPGRKRR